MGGGGGEKIYSKGTIFIKPKLLNKATLTTRFIIEPEEKKEGFFMPIWHSILIDKHRIYRALVWMQEETITHLRKKKALYLKDMATIEILARRSKQSLPDDVLLLINEYINGRVESNYTIDANDLISQITAKYANKPIYYSKELSNIQSFTKYEIDAIQTKLSEMVHSALLSEEPTELEYLFPTMFPKQQTALRDAPIAKRLIAYNNFLQKNKFKVNTEGVNIKSINEDGQTAGELALESNDKLVQKTLGIKINWCNWLMQKSRDICPKNHKSKLKIE